MIACIRYKYFSTRGYIDTQRMIELTCILSLLAKNESQIAPLVKGHNAMVDTVNQIGVSVGCDGQIAWLICILRDVKKKFTVEAFQGISGIGNEREKKVNNEDDIQQFESNQAAITPC